MYHGRFAPSPTGPLHWGSIFTAVASYLDARAVNGRWGVRIDDLDTPRNSPGAEQAILASLEVHGLHWDGPIARQSDHLPRYEAALEALEERTFYCRCARRALRGKQVYPGTCRSQLKPLDDAAVRVRVSETPLRFTDRFAGPQRVDLQRAGGDFIVRRRDGLIAYQLACAVDDGDPTITSVVRGRDLLESTPRQLWLMDLLALQRPTYGHVPTIVDASGDKLSKQHGATAVQEADARQTIADVLRTLGLLTTQDAAQPATLQDLLTLGIERWQPENPPLQHALLRETRPSPL